MHNKIELLEKFGKKIREERFKRGFSQEELAIRTGVHRTYIGMIERGEKNITLINIKKIAKAFDLTIDKLLTNL
ncbi:MAG: helix-turn-helix transcriptional regulator [bacterium]|nr:helix-turn-helix transcriptional regulator [bacterium]